MPAAGISPPSSLEGQRILVTGGAGFIGSHLVDALVEGGARVSVVDDLSTGKRGNLHPQAAFYPLSVGSAELEQVFRRESPQLVYHLAANTNVPRSVADPLWDCEGIRGSLNLFLRAREAGVRKIILASSSFVYGNVDEDRLPLTEEHPTQPVSPYAVSKVATENYLLYFHRTFGLPATIFRYGTTYGPRQAGGALADYIRQIAAGRSAEMYGDGRLTRDYTYVSDVVRANLLAFETEAANGEILNLGADRETALVDLYATVARLLGRPDNRPEFLPARAGDIRRFRVSNARARRVLGWEPTVSLEEGLRETLRYQGLIPNE